MKYLIYSFPLLAACGFYGLVGVIGGFGAFQPIVWIMLALLLLASVLMLRGKWWGCLPGIAVGILLINMGLEETGQIIKETPIGAFVFAYYTALGYARKKNRR